MSTETSELFLQMILSGLLGVTGQLLRVIVGMKKLRDEAAKKQVAAKDLIVVSNMVISILIGFVTGILAWIVASEWGKPYFNGKEKVLGIIAAGYSGTDFIEGFISKYLPQQTTPTATQTTTPEDAYSKQIPAIQPEGNASPSPGKMS